MSDVTTPRWTRLLVRLGIGRVRRRFLEWLDGPHLRARWRTNKQMDAFNQLRALDEEICKSMGYRDCCDMHPASKPD